MNYSCWEWNEHGCPLGYDCSLMGAEKNGKCLNEQYKVVKMKSKYSQIKKREAVYRTACDKAEQRYITKVFELVKHECDRWGLDFGAGNGIYVFTLPWANRHLMKLKAAAGYLQRLNEPGCDLIELISPELFEVLESDLYGGRGCCVGCQLEKYASTSNNDELVCIQSDELQVDYKSTFSGNIVSLENAREISYGPMKKNLAKTILASENACNYWQLFDEFNTNYQRQSSNETTRN